MSGKTAGPPVTGQDLFLQAAQVLEKTLLPHLTAMQALYLSCTSRGMQQWLLNMPRPSGGTWDVVPHAQAVASPVYLGGLKTIGAVLDALKVAFKAHGNMLAGRGPVQHELVSLFSKDKSPSGQPWKKPRILNILLSSCEQQYIAVAVCGQAPSQGDSAVPVGVCDVVIYSTAGGLQLKSCIPCGPLCPRLSWAAATPHLSVAKAPFASAVEKGPPEAFVWDADAGAVLHAVSAETIAAACSGKGHRFEVQWSPDGRKLLIAQHSSSVDARHAEGMLSVVDVWADTVLAQTGYILAGSSGLPATWHTSGCGILLDGQAALQQRSAYSRAQLAVGALPGQLRATAAAVSFNTDGSWLLMRLPRPKAHRGYSDSDSEQDPEDWYEEGELPGEYCLFRCRVVGLDILVTPNRTCVGERLTWVPNSLEVITGTDMHMRDDYGEPSAVVDLAYTRLAATLLIGDPLKGVPSLCSPILFSPSNRLLADSLNGARIFDMRSGRQCWKLGKAKAGSELRQHKVALMQNCQVVGFLSSGVGLVYVGGKTTEVPTLHVLSFA